MLPALLQDILVRLGEARRMILRNVLFEMNVELQVLINNTIVSVYVH